MATIKQLAEQQQTAIPTLSAAINQHQPVVELPVNDNILAEKDTDNIDDKANKPKRTKKRKCFFQRDSLVIRDSPGKDGSRRRNRHDNNNFTDHPFAILDPADLVPPGYENELATFHFVYDAVVDQLCMALADRKIELHNVNPKKHPRQSDENNGQPTVTREMRKRLKKNHPRRLIKKYESELIYFLDRVNIKKGGCDEEKENDFSSPIFSDFHDEWVNVDEVKEGKLTSNEVDKEHDVVIIRKEQDIVRMSDLNRSISNEVHEPPILFTLHEAFLVWDIGDKFARWVVHTMCRYYALTSFSYDTEEGHRLTYVCHPGFMDETGGELDIAKKNAKLRINMPKKTFFEYLTV
ncbi:8310_t:CDS:2 [Ambispora gerdemannii]|uniref:8310_t:CDS:1 n=1 Tax=Ambispora gerdemannii TaxID=144530 RepID=A0A9N8YSE3_9GLOM|nr:8310_t:CDS:2 [Ambispora gerdemannii]